MSDAETTKAASPNSFRIEPVSYTHLLLRRWRRLTPWDGVCAALLLTAVFTTMARSLWIGVAVSFVLFAVLYGALCVKNRRRFLKVMLAGLAVLAVAVTALNFLVFDGNLFGRLTGNENPQIPGQSTQRPEEENARQVQTQALLEKFSHRPVLGLSLIHIYRHGQPV